jgi:hypothetical protein
VHEKAMLGVLLGVLAKKGVLGYHHGSINQANDLFYRLSRDCFNRLRDYDDIMFPAYPAIPPSTEPVDFHAQLATGECIEILSNDLIIANPLINAIFAKTNV